MNDVIHRVCSLNRLSIRKAYYQKMNQLISLFLIIEIEFRMDKKASE